MHTLTRLPLHGGRAPRWLFERMVKLGGKIADVVIEEFGPDELVRRLSDTNWFQAFACTIGYDWHSSGTTTVTVAALKEALKEDSEIAIAGGKGKAGTNTPNDILAGADRLSLPNPDEFIAYSRLAAKTDAAMVYDNIGIYEHAFVFSKNRKWAVIQQAMEYGSRNAIRFQWFSDGIDAKDFAKEPHSGISADIHQTTLDLTAESNTWARKGLVGALENFESAVKEYPRRHEIIMKMDIGKKGIELIKKAGELEPKDYTELMLVKGVGRKTLRSLAFVASLIYGKELAYRDPVAYAYNIGGKDGIPFRINRKEYDLLIEDMEAIVDRTNIPKDEKYHALKRLSEYIENG
ncbi:MAG: DUF763 domain-containing protein [Candidatus Micrarchaeia archaeon]